MGYHQWRKEGGYEASTLLMQSAQPPLNQYKKNRLKNSFTKIVESPPANPQKASPKTYLCGPSLSKEMVPLSPHQNGAAAPSFFSFYAMHAFLLVPDLSIESPCYSCL